jgi:hypothetical protein
LDVKATPCRAAAQGDLRERIKADILVRVNDQPVYTADEFEQESRYLERLEWEAIAIEPGSRVLICGYGPDGSYVQRALAAGARVTVIEHRAEAINAFSRLGATLLRGSTSVIPAKDNSFELAIAFHYLHEIDPFFHAQVTAELARVARRVALVEPAPPADPLGKRIALLYSQAKRELGQFEYYQPLEYWKKLLQAVKADVSQHVFAFAKVPPREYLQDTVKLLLDTIEIEDAPRAYMEELRAIAGRSDVQLLPPPRYVLVGAAAGELPTPIFSQRVVTREITAKPAAAAPAQPVAAPVQPAAQTRSAEPTAREVTAAAGYEFPPIQPPATPPQPAATPIPQPAPAPAPAPPPPPPRAEPPPGFSPGLPFGAPPPVTPAPQPVPPGSLPFGVPFAVPNEEQPPATTPFGWQWEPPEQEPPA